MADNRGHRTHKGARQGREKTRQPPRANKPSPAHRSRHEPVHLPDDVVRELHATARPGKAEILVQVFADAAAAFAAGDYEEAIRLGDQSKHLALRAAAARELLGIAFYRAGRYKEAATELGAFRRISGSTDQNPVIADSYRAMGKPEKALELSDEVRADQVAEPIYFENEIVAAGALADLGRLREGIERLQRLRLDPAVAEEHHLRAWYVLGDLLEREGRFTQAREWFEAVAGADPDLTDAPERSERLKAG